MAKSGFQLGSAYGKIVLNPDGVTSGVTKAVGAVGRLRTTFGGLATSMAKGIAGAGLAIAGALTAITVSSVKMAAQLEAKLSDVQAVMQITNEEVAMLKDHVLDLGIDPELKVSAMEAAAAIEMLGRNGLKTADILEGAARSTILLQNATGSEFSQAADIATDVMALFNIRASDMITAVDGITSVVNNSKFTVTDYQYALAQAGGTASVSGVSFNDLNVSIAAMSPAFANGSSAGAAFKIMLQRMANPTGAMAQVMKELNLMTADGANLFYDEAGQMKSMSDISMLLNKSLSGLTEQQRAQAMSIMFGSHAINAASQLMLSGATVTLTAAEAMEIFGVSQDEANAMVERGITEFDLLSRAMQDTSAAGAAAARMNNLAGTMEILQGVIETLRIRIGDLFKGDFRDMVANVTEVLANNADRIIAFFATLRAIFMGFFNTVKAFFGGLSSAFNKNFSSINQQSGSWGKNIIMSLARGMAAAAMAVVQVLNRIGQIIGSLLKPGSPPKLLPNIDDWGTGTIEAWLSGFSSADFSIFDDIANTVEEHLRGIAPEGDATLIQRIMGSRGEIAAIIDQIRQTGEVGEDAFTRLQAVTGPLPQSILDYAAALFELEAAQTAVNNAQALFSALQDGGIENLNTMRELADVYGSELQTSVDAYANSLERLRAAKEGVTKAQAELNAIETQYDSILGPLNAQLREMEDQKRAIADKEKLAELDEIIAQAAADGLEATDAIAEREMLLLRMKIRETEREKDAAVDAAQEKLDAAESTAETAEELAEQQRLAAMALAQAELDAAQAALTSAREQMELSKALFDAQQKNNDLLKEQSELLAGLTDALAGVGDALAGVGDAMKEGLGDSDSLLGDLGSIGTGLGEGVSAAMDEVTDGVTDSIEQLMADIEAEFAPLVTAGETLGETWGGIFGTISEKMQTAGGFANRFRGTLDRVRSWFDENKGPIQALVDDTFGRVGQKLLELGQTVLTFAQEQGPKLTAWYEENKPLIDSFVDKLGKLLAGFVDFSTEGKIALMDFWQVVEPLLNGAVDLLLNFATFVMSVFVGDWKKAWVANQNAVTIAWEAIKGAFNGFLNWVTGWFGSSWAQVVETWNNNWEMLKEIVGTIWENVKASVATFFIDLGASLAGSFLGFITSWNEKWEELKAIPGTIWGGIQTETNTKLDEIKAAALEKVRGWFAAMGLDFDNMKARWNQIFIDIELIVFTILSRLGLYINEKILLITGFITTKFEELKVWWQKTWLEIYTFLSIKLAEIYLTIYEKFVEIETYVQKKINAVKLFIEEKITALQTWWDETWNKISAILSLILTAMVTAVKKKIQEVYDAIHDKIVEIQTWIDGKVDKFKEMGRDLIGGMKDGVLEMAGELISSVTGVIAQAIAAAMALLGIASPSTVFRGFGRNSITSFGKGFVDDAGKAASMVKSALARSIDTAARYAHMTSPPRALSMAGAQAAPSSTTSTHTSETFQFYAPITIKVESVDGATDILGQLKALTGRNN